MPTARGSPFSSMVATPLFMATNSSKAERLALLELDEKVERRRFD